MYGWGSPQHTHLTVLKGNSIRKVEAHDLKRLKPKEE